jgi:hypothetical protein
VVGQRGWGKFHAWGGFHALQYSKYPNHISNLEKSLSKSFSKTDKISNGRNFDDNVAPGEAND